MEDGALNECRDGVVVPAVAAGESVSTGMFYRNAKGAGGRTSKDIKHRDNDRRHLGGRPHKKFWSDIEDEQQGDWSVNCANCARATACSIALENDPSRRKSVVEICLDALRLHLPLGEILARYEPIQDEDGYTNLCHFEFWSDEWGKELFIESVKQLVKELDDAVLSAANDDDAQAAALAADRVLRVHFPDDLEVPSADA